MLVIYAKYKENRMEIDGVSKPLLVVKEGCQRLLSPTEFQIKCINM